MVNYYNSDYIWFYTKRRVCCIKENNELIGKWSKCFRIGLIVSIVDFCVMINQEDGSIGAKFTAVILLIGIIFCFISVVKINIYNAKLKNMSSGEYLSDRFVNAIPETKEAFGIKTNNTLSIECPYCHSTNVNRIGTINRALSIKMTGIASGKIGKQWHCNNCKSNF